MFVRIKKTIVVFSVAALIVLFGMTAVGCGAKEPNALYQPGTYSGEGRGMSGVIEVTLTVDETEIVSVDKITDPGETADIGGKEAIKDGTFVSQILDAQSADIDGVTGATLTSNGVREATQAALDQAALA